jgi:molybdopterin-guanine dinucleotide biosynthesis protein A
LPELEGWRYRQLLEKPCRVIYRHEKGVVHILHVVRGERLLDQLLQSDPDQPPNT